MIYGGYMNKEREKQILTEILRTKKVNVKELAEKLYASEPSIRRDLINLEKQGFVKRVHGGAILEENGVSVSKIPFVIRELEQSDAKIIIAEKAAKLVNDGDCIFLDASSSAYNIVPFLASKVNITVITNGIKAASKICEYGIKTICTGGELIASCLSMVKDTSYTIIDSFNADICFFSCRGLGYDGVLSDISFEDDTVRQHMIKRSKKSYLLCASEKFGKTYYHTLARVSDITGIISEKPLPEFKDQ